MKKLRNYLFRNLLLLAILLSLAIPVDASPLSFPDVPVTSSLYDSVSYLAEQGITAGTGEGRFSPEQLITARQWAVMLCRAYQVETVGETWAEKSGNSVAAACRKGWLNEGDVRAPDTKLCRGTLYESAFAAAGIPVYDASLYDGNAKPSAYGSVMRAGQELKLWKDGESPDALVNRGEAAWLLHAVLTQSFSVEPPAAGVAMENPSEVFANDYLLELRRVPESILDAFNQAGWTYSIDFDYLSALSQQLGMKCIGATDYVRKTIYVSDARATLHEFGHFLNWTLTASAEREELYRLEAQNTVLRAYARTNYREYFADCFDYWIINAGNAQRMERFRDAMPRTYAYFERLAEDHWGLKRAR